MLRVKCLTQRKLAKRALQGHKGILRTLENQDAKSAENAIRCHMDITMEDIISQTFGSDNKEDQLALLTSLGKVEKGI
jgi:DNA-binding GntR family transcriptional regulator